MNLKTLFVSEDFPFEPDEFFRYLQIEEDDETAIQALYTAEEYIFEMANCSIRERELEYETKARKKIYLPKGPVSEVLKVELVFGSSAVEVEDFNLRRERKIFCVLLAEEPDETANIRISFKTGGSPSDLEKTSLFILAADFYEVRQGKISERVYTGQDINSLLDIIGFKFTEDLNA